MLPLLEEHEIHWYASQSGLQERNPRGHAMRLMLHTQRIRSDDRYEPPSQESKKQRVRLGKRERTRIAGAPFEVSSRALSKSYGVPVEYVRKLRSRYRGYRITI